MAPPAKTGPKPTPLPLQPDTIPEQLRSLAQWVLWRYTWKGRWTKVPCRKDGRLAKVDQPSTWTTYSLALDAYRTGEFDGIGFVLTADDPYTALDLDAVTEPDGTPSDEAMAIIEMIDSYTEWSPSGQGVRILVQGELPPGRRRKGHVEVYDRDRYVTLTGTLLYDDGTYTTIEDRQEQLTDFHNVYVSDGRPADIEVLPRQIPTRSDVELLELVGMAEGTHFELLHAGDNSKDDGDASRGDLVYCKMLLRRTDDLDQVDRIFRSSARMRDKWDRRHHANGDTYGVGTLKQARLQVATETTDGRNPVAGLDGIPYDDLGNAHRLIAAHGSHLSYVRQWKKWVVYQDGMWHEDAARTRVRSLAHAIPEPLLTQLHLVQDKKQRESLLAFYHRSRSAHGTAAMVTQAEPAQAVDFDIFNPDPWLLNTPNGTIDLRSGLARDHDPADLITMQTGCIYDPEATCPQWEAFLELVLPDPEIRSFVQRLASIGLIGEPRKLFPILYGKGANGKSTFTECIAGVLGDYAVKADQELLIVQKHQGHPTSKASLLGKRFAHSGEIRDGDVLNESLVKELTGDDKITARRMYEDFWEYSPTHLLWLHANYRPQIRGTDDAIWDRVILVPFDVRIPAKDRVEHYHDLLLSQEAPGILNWLLAGLADYMHNDLQTPPGVKAATDRYRGQSDTVAMFIDSCLVVDPGSQITSGRLQMLHSEWHSTAGVRMQVDTHYNRVTAELRDQGCITAKLTVNDRRVMAWRGVGEASTDPPTLGT